MSLNAYRSPRLTERKDVVALPIESLVQPLEPSFLAVLACTLLVHFGSLAVMFSDVSDASVDPQVELRTLIEVTRVGSSAESPPERWIPFRPVQVLLGDHTDAMFGRHRCMLSPHGAVALRAIEECRRTEARIHGNADNDPFITVAESDSMDGSLHSPRRPTTAPIRPSSATSFSTF